MICRNCGSEIPEGRLYCQFCGEEVQLVPEYSSADMQRMQKALEEEKRRREQQEREEAAALRRQRNKPKPWTILLGIAVAVAIAAGFSFLGLRRLEHFRQSNPGWYRAEAERAEAEGRTDDAIAALKQASDLMGGSQDLTIKEALLLRGEGRFDEAVALLEDLFSQHAHSETVLRALLDTLDAAGRTERAAELVASCGIEAVRTDYSAYLSNPPAFSLKNGDTYAYGTMLSITSEQPGSIYYTTDSTEPDKNSLLYAEPILLETGTNRIKAVLINEKGVKSRSVAAIYNVRQP